jgi:hypothetical protein
VDHVASVAAAAFQGSPSIPTYVIGVGPALSKLEAIAQAGGTNQAFMIAVSNPAETATQLREALESSDAQAKPDNQLTVAFGCATNGAPR